MPLLDIVRGAAIQVGLSPPSVAASATDRTTTELVYWANFAVRELAQWHDWTALATDGEIVGDGATTAWTPPGDFDRMAKRNRVQRENDACYRLIGPLSGDQRTDWRARGPVQINEVFWFKGGKIVVAPALATGQKVLFEYQSSYLAATAAGTPKPAMDSDDSVSRLDEECVKMGLIWRWLRQKRLDYTQEREDWRQRAELLAGRDQSTTPIAASMPSDMDLPDALIPDTIRVA